MVESSGHDIVLRLLTAEEDYIGYIHLFLGNPPTHFIQYCAAGWQNFTVDLPSDQEKVWTITKTSTSITVTCNSVLVMNYVYSDISNADECVAAYSNDVEKIMFKSNQDTASLEYRAKPPGTQYFLF